MSLKANLATTVASVTRWGVRSVLHRNGGAAPGYLAMKIDPNLLASLANLLDASVVVTGTNGKTTTTNLIADAVAGSGALTVCNRAGNNMETGLVAALLESSSELKRARGTKRVGVFECDELYTVRVLPKLKPTYFVLLNLFRDQLDRYGEIDHTQNAIAQALASSPTTTLIFNADDPLCAAIAGRVPNPTIPFGLEGATNTETTRISDSRFCPLCNAALDYEYVQYGQLGKYRCPSCGWARPELARTAANVSLGSDGYAFDLGSTGAENTKRTPIQTKYNGLYMVYNIAAAFFAATELGANASRFQQVLDTYVPTGGRMTSWEIAGRPVLTNLAKNPVGFDRMIQQVKTANGRLVAFYLNDAEADGRDVSWLWDVDFERLADTPGLTVFVGGSRANELQVRLKYAGIDTTIVDGITPVLGAVAGEDAGETLFVIANYTAFPPVVKELEGLKDAADTLRAKAAHVADGSGVAPAAEAHSLDRPLRIVHLFPDALNLYGDGGNATVLARRCAWRGIPAVVEDIHMGDEVDLASADIVLMGGGSDRDQLAVERALIAQRDEVSAYVENDGVMLAICGSYQLMGRSYFMGDEKIEGLGIIGMDTVRGESRLTGNVAVKTPLAEVPFVGFENHGGRTNLDADEAPLGTSLVDGAGNNGADGGEGCIHRNLVGTYLHGPALPKNPALADWLLTRALERRTAAGDEQATALLPLPALDDAYEHAAREAAMRLLG